MACVMGYERIFAIDGSIVAWIGAVLISSPSNVINPLKKKDINGCMKSVLRRLSFCDAIGPWIYSEKLFIMYVHKMFS